MDSDLRAECQSLRLSIIRLVKMLTVEVISAEQTSQIYFNPPSVPLVPAFLRITPIWFAVASNRCRSPSRHHPEWDAMHEMQLKCANQRECFHSW